MTELRLSVITSAVLLAAWHLGFTAGQRSKRERSNLAQLRDVIATYKLMGIGHETAKRMVRKAAMSQSA